MRVTYLLYCSRDAHADQVTWFTLYIIFSQSKFPMQYDRLSQK